MKTFGAVHLFRSSLIFLQGLACLFFLLPIVLPHHLFMRPFSFFGQMRLLTLSLPYRATFLVGTARHQYDQEQK